MRQRSGSTKERAENVVRDIRRATRRRFSAEEKIRIVLHNLSVLYPRTKKNMFINNQLVCRGLVTHTT